MKELKDLDLSRKKYIVFDMDGTLIDSISVWNYVDYRLIKQLCDKDIDLSIIQQERDNFLKRNQSSDIYLEYCNYLIEKYNLNISKESLLELRWKISGEILEKDMDFKPYAVEVVKKLKELGYVLVLATATTQTQLDIYSKKNKKKKDKMNIEEYFDLIIKKEDVKNKKPHPEIYLSVLEYYNASPDECLVFEDSLHGIMASKSALIETVNIYDMYPDNDRAKIDALTDYKIDSYEEFLQKINSMESSVKKLVKGD